MGANESWLRNVPLAGAIFNLWHGKLTKTLDSPCPAKHVGI